MYGLAKTASGVKPAIDNVLAPKNLIPLGGLAAAETALLLHDKKQKKDETLNKKAEERKGHILEDASYGGDVGFRGGALLGAATGAASAGPAGAFLGALAGGGTGLLTGAGYGAAAGLGKNLLPLEKPEDESNLSHDAKIIAAMGGTVGALKGLRAQNPAIGAAYHGAKGTAGGALLGAGMGYLKDRDEREG